MLLLNSILAVGLATPATAQPELPILAAPSTITSVHWVAPALKLADSEGYDFSYTYLEIGFDATDLDTLPDDADSYRLRGSLGLFSILHIFADYASQSAGPVDNDSLGLGVGAHFGVGEKLDLIGEVAWLYDEARGLSSGSGSGSGSGYSVFLGGRWMVLPMGHGGLEINGGYRWIERDSGLLSEIITSNGQLGSWELGGRFHFLSAFSIGINYALLEDDTRIGLDARFSL
ncbi:MAG: hypothetical protein ACI8X5_003973 [Planctomycetota bacterium]|jgi:hypothetical protein